MFITKQLAWVTLRQQHASRRFHMNVSHLLIDMSMDFHKFGTCLSASQATTGKQIERSLQETQKLIFDRILQKRNGTKQIPWVSLRQQHATWNHTRPHRNRGPYSQCLPAPLRQQTLVSMQLSLRSHKQSYVLDPHFTWESWETMIHPLQPHIYNTIIHHMHWHVLDHLRRGIHQQTNTCTQI